MWPQFWSLISFFSLYLHRVLSSLCFFFFNDTAPTEIYTLSLHDALPISTLGNIWVVKSTDGGKSWSKPVVVSPVVDIIPVADTAFRNNSYPAADVAPNRSEERRVGKGCRSR